MDGKPDLKHSDPDALHLKTSQIVIVIMAGASASRGLVAVRHSSGRVSHGGEN